MEKITWISLSLVFVFFYAQAASNSASGHDSRPLTSLESSVFFPLVCEKPKVSGDVTQCSRLLGYAEDKGEKVGDNETPTLKLKAVTLGSLTSEKSEEAYITYESSVEPHVTNFGGGILFRRENSKWRRVRWFPGKQMDQCVAGFVKGVQRMLCLNQWEGSGEVDTSVWWSKFGNEISSEPLLKAQDRRGLETVACKPLASPKQAVLLRIRELKRSAEDGRPPGTFAEAKVSYAKPADYQKACQKNELSKVKVTEGKVYFQLKDGKVKVQTPEAFAPANY